MSKIWGRKTLKYKKWESYRRKQTATKVKEGAPQSTKWEAK